MSLNWLKSPITCDGVVVRPALDPSSISEADLRDICFRMFAILDTIEMPRCEGRLLPTSIFDRMDSLDSDLRHRRDSVRLAEWLPLIEEFGRYYRLDGREPVSVHPEYCKGYAERLGVIVCRE